MKTIKHNDRYKKEMALMHLSALPTLPTGQAGGQAGDSQERSPAGFSKCCERRISGKYSVAPI